MSKGIDGMCVDFFFREQIKKKKHKNTVDFRNGFMFGSSLLLRLNISLPFTFPQFERINYYYCTLNVSNFGIKYSICYSVFPLEF